MSLFWRRIFHEGYDQYAVGGSKNLRLTCTAKRQWTRKIWKSTYIKLGFILILNLPNNYCQELVILQLAPILVIQL